MKSKIQIDKIKEYLSAGEKIIENIGLYLYGESLNQAGEKAFEEAIELGITNTISALYEAKVQDDEIIRVVNEYWGIDKGECLDRLLWEKKEACVRAIKHQLQLQGLSSQEISNFMLENKVRIKLRHDNTLWLLKNSPLKLIDLVSEKN